MAKIVYVDMDGVLVDFESGVDKVDEATKEKYCYHQDDIPKVFSLMEPMPDAIESFKKLFNDPRYDVYILSSVPWANESAASDKVAWVKKHLEPVVSGVRKRLILSSHKHLNHGAYIIDDRFRNGVSEFQGHHLHFGSEAIPDWKAVLKFFGIE